jgi:uncharacterized protein (TIGR00730 family)
MTSPLDTPIVPVGKSLDTHLDDLVRELVDSTGVRANKDLLRDIVVSAVGLGNVDATRLDLKIVNAAITEMGRAFQVFAPYRDVPKVTMFGSARTAPTDVRYTQAREVARRLAEEGWMVVTGAGPGIMAAGMEGAGRERAIGVNIRLPFEQGANSIIADDPKLVDMRYFFTRKLMLMKESLGFIALPGGFGTLDESLELLTLIQTGKAEPAPIVFLDCPGDTYWASFERFILDNVIAGGMANAEDTHLYLITDNIDLAVGEIVGFYRNYVSRRFVRNTMVLRMRHGVSDEELAELNRKFGDIGGPAGIYRTPPLPPEVSGNDHLEYPRLALEFDRLHHSRLRQLIDAINRCNGPSPAEAAPATAAAT